jgi:Fe2+ or Zn2+ uptake regulation protein
MTRHITNCDICETIFEFELDDYKFTHYNKDKAVHVSCPVCESTIDFKRPRYEGINRRTANDPARRSWWHALCSIVGIRFNH